MKSGAGVLIVGTLELLCGTILLFIYEASKTSFYNHLPHDDEPTRSIVERNMALRTPLDFIFWISTLNNVSALFGLVGILAGQRELVIGFFLYNASQLVLTLNYFIDLLFDLKIRYAGMQSGLNGYERAAAVFLFMNFLLSVAAVSNAVKAVAEIRQKQREEYNKVSVLPDSLAFDGDVR